MWRRSNPAKRWQVRFYAMPLSPARNANVYTSSAWHLLHPHKTSGSAQGIYCLYQNRWNLGALLDPGVVETRVGLINDGSWHPYGGVSHYDGEKRTSGSTGTLQGEEMCACKRHRLQRYDDVFEMPRCAMLLRQMPSLVSSHTHLPSLVCLWN